MATKLVFALALVLAPAGLAQAQEALPNPRPEPAAVIPSSDVKTVGGDKDAADRADAEANGAWARKILDDAAAGKSDKDGKSKAACSNPNTDRKAHGEVWVGVGTGGYREYGGVVTQPLGDCSEITLGLDQTEGGNLGQRGGGPPRR